MAAVTNIAIFNNELYISGSWISVDSDASKISFLKQNQTGDWEVVMVNPPNITNMFVLNSSTLLLNGTIEYTTEYSASQQKASPFGIYGHRPIALTTNGKIIYTLTDNTLYGLNNEKIVKFDGTSISGLIGGPNPNTLNSIVYYDGKVYVAGSFTDFNGNTSLDNIGVWDGSSFGPVKTGLSAQTRVLGTYNSKLLLSGTWNTAGVINTNRNAAYNGTNWSSWISPSPSLINCCSTNPIDRVFIYGSDLFIAGPFNAISGNNNIKRMAHYNGTSWAVVGAAMDGPTSSATINAIAKYGSEIFVAGSFSSFNGVSETKQLAKWNGTDWQSAAVFMSTWHSIEDLYVLDNKLFISGYGINISGAQYYTGSLLFWDGQSWQDTNVPIGGGGKVKMHSWGDDGIVIYNNSAGGYYAEMMMLSKGAFAQNAKSYSAVSSGSDDQTFISYIDKDRQVVTLTLDSNVINIRDTLEVANPNGRGVKQVCTSKTPDGFAVFNLQGGTLKKSIYVGSNLSSSSTLAAISNNLQLNCPNFKNERAGILLRSNFNGTNRYSIADELLAE